jgi:hypothetical protein
VLSLGFLKPSQIVYDTGQDAATGKRAVMLGT